MTLKKLPILILCYNKLNNLKKVISIINDCKYSNVYISLDGPCSNRDIKSLNVHSYILQLKKKKKFKFKINKSNKGCKKAVSDGINWFFKNEKYGVILEEDCIPSKSFFKFCYLLLNKFKNNKKIGHISGTNPLKKFNNKYSYFFSNYGGVWGWATWRDRWKKYDLNMKAWSNYKKIEIYNKSNNLIDFLLRYHQFSKTYKRKIDTWDYQWSFTKINNNYLSVIPAKNLITNMGFNVMAKHTKQVNNNFSKIHRYEIKFPLNHNNKIQHCNNFYNRVVEKRVINLINKYIRWVK